ncbi:MAG TPA: MBOAT family O-acyltransferase [Pedobacter sp.]|jgi:D-alanyl-lipoteichoic acid acyltransferase DltB (MBOAT superfamily)
MTFVPVYILILGFTILIDFLAGIQLEKTSRPIFKKTFFILSLAANITVLGIFKYYNFFLQNIERTLNQFNYNTALPFLSIALPIGLSFHTFQAMSYIIEVYRGNQRAETHFGIYALYVMFYPQLVAGPIERPQNVLHQFHRKHIYNFEDLKSGLVQMAWGMFKKVVIADRLALLVDYAYENPSDQNVYTVILANVFYAFQIYCDFSGYSDIGIGAARVMGFKLMDNFKMPYLSKSLAEFWSRWHISLSTWFRDYLYIPLGGNRGTYHRTLINIFVVFLISGLWHGASWNFVIWGALHGFYLIIGKLKNSLLERTNYKLRNTPFWKLLQVIITFLLVDFAWIFFRAPNLATVKVIISKLTNFSPTIGFTDVMSYAEITFCFFLIIVLLAKEKYLSEIPTPNRSTFLIVFTILMALCYLFGIFNNNSFIYFKF